MWRWRMVLGLLGGMGMAFGLVALITSAPARTLLLVAAWLVAALVLHDLVWSPALIGLGAVVARAPARARTYVQGGLVVCGSLTVVAIPMIYLRGRQPPSKAILPQDVGANLLLLIGLVAVITLMAYVVRTLRDRARVIRASRRVGRSDL